MAVQHCSIVTSRLLPQLQGHTWLRLALTPCVSACKPQQPPLPPTAQAYLLSSQLAPVRRLLACQRRQDPLPTRNTAQLLAQTQLLQLRSAQR